jgi:hypothetical protein
METLQEVLEFNKELLRPNMGQKHTFVVLARKVSDGEGGFKLEPVFKPDQARLHPKLRAAGLGNQSFLRVYSFVRDNIDGGVVLSDRDTFRNIFENESNVYDYLLEQVLEGNVTEKKVTYTDRRTGEQLIKLQINSPIYGETISLQFPPHYAIETDANGNLRRLQSTQFEDGDYKSRDTVLTGRTFFFFPTEDRVRITTRYFNRFVKPYRATVSTVDDGQIAGVEQGAANVNAPVGTVVQPQQPVQGQQPQAQQPNSAALLGNAAQTQQTGG